MAAVDRRLPSDQRYSAGLEGLWNLRPAIALAVGVIVIIATETLPYDLNLGHVRETICTRSSSSPNGIITY